MRIIWLLCLSLLTSSVGAEDFFWRKLKHESNMIVLMRNVESSGNRDGTNMLIWDESGKCNGESTLTDEGKAHANKIGAAFLKHGIKPIVISSPMCRCTQTAEIAFENYLTHPDLRQRPPEDTNGQDSFQAKASEFLSTYRGSTPIVFVNHRPNIDSMTMELIGIGELLLGAVAEDGEVELVGKIRVDP